MVYVQSLEEFGKKAEELFLKAPQKTRYTMKYRHIDALLVLKITDDRKIYKYRTQQQTDLKTIEKLNNTLMNLMSTKDLPEVEPEQTEAAAKPEKKTKGGSKKKKAVSKKDKTPASPSS